MSAENLGIVLGHLADNALRHGVGRIEISAQVAAGRMWLTVADDGAGISANNRARIFDNFFTTLCEQGGTGMGLAIVRAMPRAMRSRPHRRPGFSPPREKTPERLRRGGVLWRGCPA